MTSFVARHADPDDDYYASEVDDLGALIRGELEEDTHPGERRGRHRKRGRLVPVLAALVAVVIAAGAVYFAKEIFSSFRDVPDYAGEGTESVAVRIDEGDTLSDIATKLADAGVVKSARAFTDAAAEDEASKGLQPGLYTLKKEMKASLALAAMLDPSAIQTVKVTVPEGLTVDQTLAALAEGTGLSVEELQAALDDRANLGLPAWAPADAKLEGFLQPGTYTFDPEDTPLSIIQTLVAQFNAVAAQTGLEQKAAGIGQSPYSVLTIASLIEEEAKWDEERPMIAQVVYNRLAVPMPLQIDASTAYGVNKPGNELTKDDLADASNPYNLRVVPGLPPTPIASVGAPSIEAALNPADGTWIYYVVNSADGHHAFVTTDAEFTAAKQVCQQNGWC